jgi:hypothetical protein
MAVIEAIGIPDTNLCKQITELVHDTEPELLSLSETYALKY